MRRYGAAVVGFAQVVRHLPPPAYRKRSGVEPIVLVLVLVLSRAATVLVIDTNVGTAALASVAMF